MPFTLVITDEKLQEAFDSHINSLLTKGNYDNPVKKAFDTLLGYNGSMTKEFNAIVESMAREQMKTPEFAAALGKAMAEEIAKREVDKLKK
jgi:hypothetical protein